MRSIAALAVLAGLVACTGVPPPAPTDCVSLFERFDLIEATMSTAGPRRDQPTIRPELQRITSAIRQYGCISLSRELNFDAAPTAPIVESGPRLVPPVRIHAGAVTSMSDDAAARAFFESHGLRATSIGSAALGRRIYVGPFATRGALDAALALARSAGFTHAYPARF
ncbi:hypothetical protein HNP73_003568 [Amaricoccus macauensis]|uniref:SPOR domain-containing protein n=1 Tax=Amaricoccus macauensis TaxID=57001 RepID=A0A840SR80_9RHOB|nr:hypothetical protein [Amaricoccus macauensis]MBB5223614.1 hypothetical protein [Amaricoccus macauensis]